uniref:Translocation protein SEC62 n=1 Tax=Brugia malayi TaxID=6279 RepID=A0A0H5S609_BRUMA|nr:Bm2303 [Brugia malayi]
MADRRKGGRKKTTDGNQKLTKEEDTIARYVRFNCPTKTTMFEGNEVHYFTGTKAVDTLYESKKYGHAAKNVKFTTRQAAVIFMRSLLEKGLFFRARKLVPKKKDDKKDQKERGVDVSKSPRKKSSKNDQAEREKEKEREKHKEEKKEESDDNDEENGKEKDKKKEEEEKKKRKIKLELHQEQSFNDANDVYVWIFDPTPLYKKIIGALMVLGTIAGCLFPLWPMWLRQGVYYLSVCGLACFGLLIGVAVARTILFAIIWAVTMGKHKLWLLPNLTEDCGFFESFQPWYTYEYCSSGNAASSKKKKRDGKKKSDSEEPLVSEKEMKSGDSSSQATEINKKVGEEKQSRRKESGDENADLGNGNENDETDEEGDTTSDSDGRSSQETNGSLNNGADTGSGGNGSDDPKIRLRRRARKADDDFVLVHK